MQTNDIKMFHAVRDCWIDSIKSMAGTFLFASALTMACRLWTSPSTAIDEGLRIVHAVNLEPLGNLLIGLVLISVPCLAVHREITQRIGRAAIKRVEDFVATTIAVVCGVLGGLATVELIMDRFCSAYTADPNAWPVLLSVFVVWLQGCYILFILAGLRNLDVLFSRVPKS